MSGTLRSLPVIVLALTLNSALAGESDGNRDEPAAAARVDRYGDPLPDEALTRLGTLHFRSGDDLSTVALSPDGKLLAVAGPRAGIQLWDTATGKEVRRFPEQHFIELGFSPNGKTLAGSSQMGMLALWDVTTGNQLQQFQSSGNGFGHFVFSADSRVLAAGDDDPGPKTNHVYAWETASGKQIGDLEVLHECRVGVALSPDGKVLVSWGEVVPRAVWDRTEELKRNRTLQLWDLDTGKELRQLCSETDTSRSAAVFSPDGKTLVTSGRYSGLTFWEVGTGKVLRRLATRDGTGGLQLSYSPDGKTLVAESSSNSTVVLQSWEVATGKRFDLYEGPASLQTGFRFTRAGRLLAWSLQERAVVLWDVSADRPLSPMGGHQGSVSALSFTPNGQGVVSCSTEGKVCLWDLRTAAETRQATLKVEEDRGPVPFTHHRGLLVSPDTRYLVSHDGGGLRLWDSTRGRKVCFFPSCRKYQECSGVAEAFSADGRLLAAIGSDSEGQSTVVHLWDVNSGQELTVLRGHQGVEVCVALAPDGKFIASGSNFSDQAGRNEPVSEVIVWEVATGKKLYEIQGSCPVQGLSFSPDETLLAVVGETQAVLRDTATGKELRRLDTSSSFPMGPLVFSPDGRLMAADTRRNQDQKEQTRLQLWEVASGGPCHEFVGQRGAVSSLAFSPDGRTLASGGSDTTVLLWDLTGQRAGQGRPTQFSNSELEELWSQLAGDAHTAYRAVRLLAGCPRDSVPFLQKQVHPVPSKAVEDRWIAKWIDQLDGDDFQVRRQAAKELQQVGKSAESAFRKALADNPSAEVRRRIEDLLEKLEAAALTGEMLRPLRAVEVLERAATPEARQVLETLAGGREDALLTQEARAARDRLDKLSARP